MTQVSPLRLLAMRAFYLFMAVGLALTVWPFIISHDPSLPLMNGVVFSLLGMIGLLALLGLRYPLQMLPLLLFEFGWKMLWLIAFALPLWLDGALDERTRSTVFDTAIGAVLLLIIPWRYVYDTYIRRPAEPWRFRSAEGAGAGGAGAAPN